MARKAHIPVSEEEILDDLQEPQKVPQTEDQRFQMRVYELVEQLQDACPYLTSDSVLRRMLAQYGEAYFFFNKTGGLCFLTGFVKSLKES